MKKHISNSILAIIFIAGLSLLLYPSFSNWWNQSRSSKAIDSYNTMVSEMNDDETDKLWNEAEKYNKKLFKNGQHMNLTKEEEKLYNSMLTVGTNPVIGYVEVDRLSINLPIYHGVSESVLTQGIGHLNWSSLPVGGKNTHCVLSGHRGLPSARLFTDISEMKEGDLFRVHVLGKTLVYEVDQIRTVLPKDTTELTIKKGKDYCTLVTCTPYGINTHRLLVRGHRVEDTDDSRIVNEVIKVDPVYVASAMTIIILLCIIGLLVNRSSTRKKKNKKNKNNANNANNINAINDIENGENAENTENAENIASKRTKTRKNKRKKVKKEKQ